MKVVACECDPEFNNDERAEMLWKSFQQYRERLLPMVEDILGSNLEAEEVIQDAFLRAYRALPAFKGNSQLYTWVYRIAVNLAKNRRRSTFRRGESIALSDIEYEPNGSYLEMSPDSYLPFHNMIRQEIHKLLNISLSQLSPDIRQVVILRHCEDLSYEEIARMLQCPVGTVRSRLFRARRSLRSIINRSGENGFNLPEKDSD